MTKRRAVPMRQSSPIFIRRSGVIGSVNSHFHVVILPSVVECQRTDWVWGMPISSDWSQKSVTIVKSPERSRKEGRINHAHPYTYLSWKFGEDRSRMFWDWSPSEPLKKAWEKATLAEHIAPSACHPGARLTKYLRRNSNFSISLS